MGNPLSLLRQKYLMLRIYCKVSDLKGFQSFSLSIHLLVGTLKSLKDYELTYCSHVGRLLNKLPRHLRDNFTEHLQLEGKLDSVSLNP